MVSKKKKLKWIVLAVILFEILYLLGKKLLPMQNLEYRTWVDTIGQILLFFIIPILAVIYVLGWLAKKCSGNKSGQIILRIIKVLIICFFFIFWSYPAFLIMLLSAEPEQKVMPGLLAVDKGGFPAESWYAYYEPVGFFFRRETEVTPQMKLNWITHKYERKFQLIENGDSCLFQDSARPIIQASVSLTGAKFTDDYIEKLSVYYLKKGYDELSLSREIWTNTPKPSSHEGADDNWRLVLESRMDIPAFCTDASLLVNYAAASDDIFEDHSAWLHFSLRELGSGNSSNLSSLSFKNILARESDPVELQNDVHKIYDMTLQQAKEDIARNIHYNSWKKENAQEKKTPEPVLTESQQAEGEWPDQARAARAVYESFLKESGCQFEPRCNAKGNFYVDLGLCPADYFQNTEKESHYYLTYDRESKNGNCYLFVLSEEPLPEEEGSYGDIRLREFYAVEKATGKAVAAGKTKWEQTGSAKYRELTGE